MSMSEKAPYFDVLFDKFGKNRAVEDAFGLNVHWGFWQDPSKADGSTADFQSAARAMNRRVYGRAQLQNGMRVLDVGCGFGGTLSEINETYSNMELVGLNLDPRQLVRARERVVPRRGNKITFVEGDACALPFPEHRFDAVLAVEC